MANFDEKYQFVGAQQGISELIHNSNEEQELVEQIEFIGSAASASELAYYGTHPEDIEE